MFEVSLEPGCWRLKLSRLHLRTTINHLRAEPRIADLRAKLNPVRAVRRAGECVLRHGTAEDFDAGELFVRAAQRLSERDGGFAEREESSARLGQSGGVVQMADALNWFEHRLPASRTLESREQRRRGDVGLLMVVVLIVVILVVLLRG